MEGSPSFHITLFNMLTRHISKTILQQMSWLSPCMDANKSMCAHSLSVSRRRKKKKKSSNLASLWGAGIREIWGRTLEDNCDF